MTATEEARPPRNNLDRHEVVTCFLRSGGDVLLLRRSDGVGSYRGRWGGVAGYAEGDPAVAARREIAEETGLGDAVRLVRRGSSFEVEDAELRRIWVVHPFLYECDRRDFQIDWESTEAEWVAPYEILRRPTVPKLWRSWRQVAPTLREVDADRTRGASWLSMRALEVLRDRAAEIAWTVNGPAPGPPGSREELLELARTLVASRPSMAVLANRIRRVWWEASVRAQGEPLRELAASIARQAHAAIGAAVEADAGAARQAARLVAGRTVLVFSRSETVLASLRSAPLPPRVLALESRPGGEGEAVARELRGYGLDVKLLPDAAVGAALLGGLATRAELVLVGADTLFPDGAVINKIGTLTVALAARRAATPCYVVSASDKMTPHSGPRSTLAQLETADGADCPLFELVPAELLSGVVTESGVLDHGRLLALARELNRYRLE